MRMPSKSIDLSLAENEYVQWIWGLNQLALKKINKIGYESKQSVCPCVLVQTAHADLYLYCPTLRQRGKHTVCRHKNVK